jgi:hypothetical protein
MSVRVSFEHFESPPVNERTPRTFLATNDWDQKLGQTDVYFVWLWYRAEDCYPDTSAHNFPHATDTLWYANNLCDAYEAANPDKPLINRKLLNAAVLFHDAGKNEAEAAANFRRHAKELDYNEAETITVENMILSTAEDIEPTTPEEVIMSIADLHTVGEPWSVFRRRGEDFLREAKEALGSKFVELQFRSENVHRLAKYVTKSLVLDGIEANWLKCAQENVRNAARDLAARRQVSLEVLMQEAGGRAIAKLFGKDSTN